MDAERELTLRRSALVTVDGIKEAIEHEEFETAAEATMDLAETLAELREASG